MRLREILEIPELEIAPRAFVAEIILGFMHPSGWPKAEVGLEVGICRRQVLVS